MNESFRALPAREQQIAALTNVRGQLQTAINATGIDVADKKFFVVSDTLSIESKAAGLIPFPGYESDRFLFSGELLVPGPVNNYLGLEELATSEVAAIQHLQIPQALRRHGVAKQLVGAWEEAWFNQGIRTFIAKGVREGSEEFWLNLGYKFVENRFPGTLVSAHTPRHMMKTR